MNQLFFSSIENNDLSLIKKLIDNGIDINAKDEYGLGALHIASFKGANEAAFFLIDRNIDLNIQDKSGQTVLHYAALNNQVELAKLALKKGALLSLEDMHGNQPLWTAVFNDKGRNDRIKIITLFLEHGADPNHKNKVGKSPKDIIAIANYNNLKSILGIN